MALTISFDGVLPTARFNLFRSSKDGLIMHLHTVEVDPDKVADNG